jgi:hypothetical protein
MHAARNALRASGVWPKQGLALSNQTSRRRGVDGPCGAVGAPGHAATLGQDDTQTGHAQLGGRRAGSEAGLAFGGLWVTRPPSRLEGTIHCERLALGVESD